MKRTLPCLAASATLMMMKGNRFGISRRTLVADAVMSWIIRAGGVSVILAVFGIVVFILSQVFPLFRGATAGPDTSVSLPEGDYVLLGADEWSELPFVVDTAGQIRFVDMTLGAATEPQALVPGKTVTAISYDPERFQFVLGLSDGSFATARLGYRADCVKGERKVRCDVELGDTVMLEDRAPVLLIGAGETDASRIVAAYQEPGGVPHLKVMQFARKRSLVGKEAFSLGRTFDLAPHLTGRPRQLLVANQADSVLVLQDNGEVEYYFVENDRIELRQKFKPFDGFADSSVASMGFLLGDGSLVFTHPSGANRVFSLYVKPGETIRRFWQTKEFPPLEGGAEYLSKSLRNKAFLAGAGNRASLRYATTESVRWEGRLPFRVRSGVIGGKYETLLFLEEGNCVHRYTFHDPHPEASLRGLFGKVWYEGASEPRYEWQSTGGTDEFEPKLSLIPLIFGTLKGTFYAMALAAPIALLAALYTSQFMRPEHRAIVKPVMEVMASLPSVVLGFLAALWLAPMLDQRMPSVLAIVILVPSAASLFGYLWSRLPIQCRLWIPPGYEFLAFLPVLILIVVLGWKTGPWIERLVFVVTDPVSGESVADFRRWWPSVTETAYEQRNSLVVGFMMGFAVIPIIFTITEDALSNVPHTLRYGSLALGASRWQTALHVVIPTASAGIFSALMIGLGRAVGETMIVVMATGNTPIMEWNPFTGMRALSANIAVELPEAPHHGTLYRTLFLGAMVLFFMTFLVNTLAELLRQHLRRKYQTA